MRWTSPPSRAWTSLQIHGNADEFPAGIRLWKAVRVGAGFQFAELDSPQAEAFLLDTPSETLHGGTGRSFDWKLARGAPRKIVIAGGLDATNVRQAIEEAQPWGVDACSRLEAVPGRKDHLRMARFLKAALSDDARSQPDAGGHFGPYGGRYVPETLMAPLEELETGLSRGARRTRRFQAELDDLLRNYAGRPTPLYFARRLSETLGGARIYLKREDLLHTGAHKINNCLGQVLLARRMGKKRIIAETGAGQHGVATATVCALFGLECVVYMGEEDMRRQRLNVFRMRLLGAQGRGGRHRQPHAQGRHQRGHARLGDQRRDHALPARLGAGRASVPADGARFPERDRRGGAAADSGGGGPPAGCGDRLRGRRQQRHRHLPRLPSGREGAADRRRGGRPGRGAGRARGALRGRLAGRAAGRLQLPACRTTTGRWR